MPCCKTCCGCKNCTQGQAGKCCCGGAAGTCCDTDQVCCGNQCCDSVCCSGVCCSPGQVCCRGVCCEASNCCNGVCCPPGTTCVNGVCRACDCPSVNYKIELLSPVAVPSVAACNTDNSNFFGEQTGPQCGAPANFPGVPTPFTDGFVSYNQISLVSSSQGITSNTEPEWLDSDGNQIYTQSQTDGFVRWDVKINCESVSVDFQRSELRIAVEMRALAQSSEYGISPDGLNHFFSNPYSERAGRFWLAAGDCLTLPNAECGGGDPRAVPYLSSPLTITPTFVSPDIAGESWPYVVEDPCRGGCGSGNTANTLPCLNTHKAMPFSFRISSFTSVNPLP